jgi:hypothetical protein
MRRWMLAFVVASVLAAANPASAQDTPQVVTDGVAFHVDLPGGVVLTRRPVIDFDIYQVTVEGRPIAGFYEGFAADVSWAPNRRSTQRQQRNRPDGGGDFFWSRECMPTEVHGWIFPSLSHTDALLARAVVESLRMRPCV